MSLIEEALGLGGGTVTVRFFNLWRVTECPEDQEYPLRLDGLGGDYLYLQTAQDIQDEVGHERTLVTSFWRSFDLSDPAARADLHGLYARITGGPK